MNLGATNIRLGDIPAAREHLRVAQTYFEQAQARDFLPELYRHGAEADLCVADYEGAARTAQQALDIARELSARTEEGCCLRVLGMAALAQGRYADAQDALDRSLVILTEIGDIYESARTHYALAFLYVAQRRFTESVAALDQCIPVFMQLGAALDLTDARGLRQKVDQYVDGEGIS